MPSFQNSDSNGYSDFTGMTSGLDYLQTLGFKGIWLTPFLKSFKVDNGYDVTDYYAIDSVYFERQAFKTFLHKAQL
jgi:trehalose-6-phosphate hydrolase